MWGPLLFLGFLWLIFGKKSGGGAGIVPAKVNLSPVPGAGPKPGPAHPGALPEPLPPAPKPVPKPIPLPIPNPLAPGNSLTISGDCKSVSVGGTWWENVAKPDAAALIANGVGLPIYTAAQADRSIDAAVRTIVAKSAGVACVNDAPWLDRYVKIHALPKPIAGETREEYSGRLQAWDSVWDATISGWAASHPALFGLFKEVGALVYQGWAIARQVNPGYEGFPNPQLLPPGLNAGEEQAILLLGYDHHDLVLEVFQSDFNLVQNFRTNLGWTINGMDIDVDNEIGPQTRYALKEALQMDAAFGGWPAVLEAAKIG